MSRILDQFDVIEAAVPQLRGRVDRSRVAVAGHSMGGHTASMLLGARLTDPLDGTEVDLTEPRITAGVLLAAPGRGGDALSAYAAEHYAFFRTMDFSRMTTPALVVAGDKDASAHLTVLGPRWHTDPYVLAPGRKSLLTLFGAEHGLGGVSGYDVAETTDESPERVAAVQRLTWAYLRGEFHPGDPAWQAAQDALTSGPGAVGRVESKQG
jgi:predicted dienelactone hydrolase